MKASPYDIDALNAELRPDLDIVRLLGTGAMSSVFLAREAALRRLVAVKILLPQFATDEVARLRFQREAHSAARLSHANITAVYRIGALSSEVPYLVIQYIEAGTLADRIRATGPLNEASAVRVLEQIAMALAAAHRQGIIHRDIRPGNVLYDPETGNAVLTDFGLAAILVRDTGDDIKLTKPGERLGDPAYLSPEQFRGEPITAATDIYSLGLMAYDLLGAPGPFDRGAHLQTALATLRAEPSPLASMVPSVSAELSALVIRCLARAPEHRPAANDVVAALRGEATSAPRSGDGSDLLGKLIHRRVAPITLAYIAAAWIMLGFIDQLVDRGLLPEPTYRLLLGPFIGGLVAAVVLAWFHGARGRQEFRRLEIILLIAAGLIGLTIGAVLLAF